MRVFLVDNDDRSGVNEEMFVSHLHIGCIEIPESLVDLRRYVIGAPEVARLLADVNEENRVVGLEYLEAFRLGYLLDLKHRNFSCAIGKHRP